MLSTEKKLEMKINQHKMLMNTLHEMFRMNDVPGKTIEVIKAEINDTLKEIEELRKDVVLEAKAATVSMFDGIKKENGCCNNTNCKCNNNYDKVNYEFYSNISKSTENVVESSFSNKLIFSDRFTVNLDDLNIPSNAIKAINFVSVNERRIDVEIYDFVGEDYYGKAPLMKIIEDYDTRKFTIGILHLNDNGNAVYTEKYNGCIISDVFRSPLDYNVSNANTIILSITYDGVSYETTN